MRSENRTNKQKQKKYHLRHHLANSDVVALCTMCTIVWSSLELSFPQLPQWLCTFHYLLYEIMPMTMGYRLTSFIFYSRPK